MVVFGKGDVVLNLGKCARNILLKILRIFEVREFPSLENILMGWGWSLLCLLWSHVIDTHYGRGGDWRKTPSFLLQTIICGFAPLFGQKGRYLMCLGICPCGGHRRTWIPLSLSTLVSWDRVNLWTWSSLPPQLGWQATKGQLHCPCLGGTLWSHLTIVHAGWEQSTHALAFQSFSLPSYLLLNHFFSNLNLSETSLLSNHLHLPTSWWSCFLFLSSSIFCMEGTRLQSGSKNGSLTDTYSLILARSYFWAEPVAQFYSMCLAWTTGGGRKG